MNKCSFHHCLQPLINNYQLSINCGKVSVSVIWIFLGLKSWYYPVFCKKKQSLKSLKDMPCFVQKERSAKVNVKYFQCITHTNNVRFWREKVKTARQKYRKKDFLCVSLWVSLWNCCDITLTSRVPRLLHQSCGGISPSPHDAIRQGRETLAGWISGYVSGWVNYPGPLLIHAHLLVNSLFVCEWISFWLMSN